MTRREIARLPGEVKGRVLAALTRLGEEPRHPGVTKLTDAELYRVRVGPYRVVFAISDRPPTIRIARVLHRRDAYR